MMGGSVEIPGGRASDVTTTDWKVSGSSCLRVVTNELLPIDDCSCTRANSTCAQEPTIVKLTSTPVARRRLRGEMATTI